MIWSAKDKAGCRFALLPVAELNGFPENTDPTEVFARILRTIRSTAKFPIRLPISWSEYHFKSLIAFFALPRTVDRVRWIAEIDDSQKSVKFLGLTTPSKPQELEKFAVPITPNLRDQVDAAVSTVSDIPRERELGFVDRVDFVAIGSAAISKSLTFEQWLDRLKPSQSEVLEIAPSNSVRIVGPAGSGKTLMLCMRALSQVRAAARDGQPIRALFATHSWAMAERIDDTLTGLNAGQPVSSITVYPFLQILNEIVGGSILRGLRLLGDDSTDGRRLQIGYLSESVAAVGATDRAILRAQGLSTMCANALEESGPARAEVVENVYEEINGVLLAEGLIPGDRRKEEEYLSRVRADDLPPFPLRGDRAMVLLVYRDFLSRLREREFITTDQLVSDATKVLETFAWGVKRESEGFDLILIDELQLFDAQERFALALLASSPDETAFVTAEDPSQGLFSSISPAWQKDVPSRKARRQVELTAPLRFTPGILSFVYRLYRAFPLNAHALSIEALYSQEGRPHVVRETSAEDAVRRACEFVGSVANQLTATSRLAVISVDGSAASIASSLRKSGMGNTVEILSLDDVDKLSYARRAVVIGEWQFLGGTQFTHVIVVGAQGVAGKSTFMRVRELTALYVSCSRAAQWLCLVLAGDVHPEVSQAIEDGLLVDSNAPTPIP
ncbi:MAG: hypothetical protein PHW25_08625 [Zoogloea sp.]|uniref:UvrD-helicase domain-containing protein n=1 Tax=Zoogloea sp. TaxID=49181 RepID=UPI00262093A4|nr:UvrD-helicase domain-containing protein [Zoogloea sp.]MDD3327135.1 hypothetical protein [Zoogloea sp.]